MEGKGNAGIRSQLTLTCTKMTSSPFLRPGIPKPPPGSVDDDLGLGADAESVTGSSKEEDIKEKQVTGPG